MCMLHVLSVCLTQEAIVADLQETLKQTEEAVQAVQVSTTSYIRILV